MMISEYTVANEALKNAGGKERMNTVHLMFDIVGLSKSFRMCGVSKKE